MFFRYYFGSLDIIFGCFRTKGTSVPFCFCKKYSDIIFWDIYGYDFRYPDVKFKCFFRYYFGYMDIIFGCFQNTRCTLFAPVKDIQILFGTGIPKSECKVKYLFLNFSWN